MSEGWWWPEPHCIPLYPHDPCPSQCYGLWDHEEDPFAKKKAEAEQAEEEEERQEEAVSPAVPAESAALGAAVGSESEGNAQGQKEGSGDGATHLRFRRKRQWGKEPAAVVEEGEYLELGKMWSGREPDGHPCCLSLTEDGEEEEGEEEEEEEEEETKQSHSQKKLKAFGLRVKLFFLTM